MGQANYVNPLLSAVLFQIEQFYDVISRVGLASASEPFYLETQGMKI